MDLSATSTPLILPDPLPTEGPVVSVLIPLYNYEHYIGECLASVLSQSYRSLEVVVVDNASTDHSVQAARDVAGDDERVTFFANETTVDVLSNFFRCYQLSSGTLVKFLSADDRFCDSDALACLVAAIESAPDIALATSERALFTDDGRPYLQENSELLHDVSKLGVTGDTVMDGMAVGNYFLTLSSVIGQSLTLFRRSRLAPGDFFTVGGQNVGEDSAIEVAWWLTIAAGSKVAYLDRVLSQTRIHSSSDSHRMVRSPRIWRSWFAAIEGAKALGYLTDPAQESAALFVQCINTVNATPDLDQSDPEALRELFDCCQRALIRIKELVPDSPDLWVG